jgi:hypothetical protein
VQTQAPPLGGNPESPSVNMLMVKSAAISTRSKNYDSPESDSLHKDPLSTTPPNGPLTLENPSIKPFLCPPKGVLHCTTHNPNARVDQHYNIVEYLSQAPFAMSALEVLQSYPAQHKALLSSIGGIDPIESNVISFDTNCNESHLSHQLAIQITARSLNKMFTKQCLMKALQHASCP